MAFHILSNEYRCISKYKINRRCIVFRIGEVPDYTINVEQWFREGIQGILNYICSDIDPSDRVGFCLSSENLTRGDAYLSFRKASSVSFEDIWNLLGKIHQSNSEAFQFENFRISVTLAKEYRGGAGNKLSGNANTFADDCNKRRGIITIKNSDNLCLPRALVVAIAYIKQSPNLKQIRKNTGKRQDMEVKQLLEESGITIPPRGAGIVELQKFQNYLTEFKISVYKYGCKGRELLFEGPDAEQRINLLHHEEHFNVITSLTSAFCCGYFCEFCHIPYNQKNTHRCTGICPCCRLLPACEKTPREEVQCADCNRSFRGLSCYNRHKTIHGKETICDQVKKCRDCLRTYSSANSHNCDHIYCQTCRQYQPIGHHCFIAPNTSAPPQDDDLLYIFFDLETRQDEVSTNGDNIHVPNLCVFIPKCSGCFDDPNHSINKCKCLGGVKVLQRFPLDRFMEYVLGIRKAFKRVIILAHNGQGFDHIFCLRHVIEKTDLKVELIMRGSKILFLGIENIRFIDSLSYFPMPLSSLPQAFDLGPELRKGYFPHLFNTVANSNYIGPLPDTRYYDPDSMKEDQRTDFLKWYGEHKNDIFNIQKELINYCISDVDILTKACLKFRKMMLTECGIEPFAEAITIASACNLVFRRNFLKPNTIGLIPKRGYRNVDRQSKIATQWLIWEERQRGIDIAHSAKQRETILEGLRVDGYNADTNQVFEFQGCYFHGCSNCFTTFRDSPLQDDPSDTLNNRLSRTNAKVARLRQKGYLVIEKFECDFRREMAENPEIAAYTESHPLISYTPLNVRDAFFGGRTGNCKSYYQCQPGEKIKYVDVCSLYPFVCKFGRFPVGHPQVYVGTECDKLNLRETHGLIKCKVVPPTKLYHPVLPMKANDKLMFGLCRTCMVQLNQAECKHNEEERALLGTWVIEEVNKAIEKGYRLVSVFEVWSYQTVQHDKMNKVEGLFTAMMDKFVKVKQQASGWPEYCTTEEERLRYIEEFLEREDVRLEYSEIIKNPGLRSMAKLMLNSFWGKFGQRENQPKTAIIRTVAEYLSMIHNPSVEIKDISIVNEETLLVNYEHLEDAFDPNLNNNACLAAFVTCHARMKLYSYLEKLGDRVLYYDTDSIIYISREGQWEVPTGSFLGDMTNELEEYGSGSYIYIFSSCGPKNYSYIVFSPQYHTYFTTCKVKGIRLNYNAVKLVNFNSMRSMALGELEDPIHITCKNIRRNKNHQVITRTETKVYRACNEKRKFDDSFGSVPYGYKKHCTESC